MSAVNETIVKEYFESLGFFVREPCKHHMAARGKRAEEEIDLLVYNPLAAGQGAPADMVWAGAELRGIARAIVGIRGWHSDYFSPAMLNVSPDVYSIADPSVLLAATKAAGEGPFARILCLPNLPSSKAARKAALDILRGKGIDGVILFRTMLLELAASVDAQKSYEKSDFLQVLRILKKHALLKDAQMELFPAKRRNAKPK